MLGVDALGAPAMPGPASCLRFADTAGGLSVPCHKAPLLAHRPPHPPQLCCLLTCSLKPQHRAHLKPAARATPTTTDSCRAPPGAPPAVLLVLAAGLACEELEEGAEDTLGERLVLPSDVFPVEVSKLKIIQNT